MSDFVTKDTGSRREFETGAVRDVNEGKPRYDLIPPTALRRWADLMARGAAKYGDRNWERGMAVSVYVESLLRHVYAFIEGDTVEDHLAAILFNAGAITFIEEKVRRGDLPATLLDAGASAEMPAPVNELRQPVREVSPYHRILILLQNNPQIKADVSRTTSTRITSIEVEGGKSFELPDWFVQGKTDIELYDLLTS